MLVTTLDHGRLVMRRLEAKWQQSGRRHLAIDTETSPMKGHPRDDALIYGRCDVLVFSICHMGEAYSFPTSHFGVQFPLPEEWAEEILLPLCLDASVVKVAHNWTYDYNVLFKGFGVPNVINFWDTLIGCWKASEWLPKGLKSRAPYYGRVLRQTSTVKFTDLKELADYAEEDVVQTDEIYQMHIKGRVERPSILFHKAADGSITSAPNPLALRSGQPLVVPHEALDAPSKAWLRYLELPVLRAVIRAQRRGFPLDVGQLQKIRTKLQADIRTQRKYLYRTAGEVFNINSGGQLAKVCKQLKIHNPHRSKTGKVSFNARALEKIKDQHPFLRVLSEHKALTKLSSVYVGSQPFRGKYDAKDIDCGLEYFVSVTDGSIHTTINTVGAITGRSSSSGPNLQQVPSRKDQSGIKDCFVATPRPASYHVLVRKYPERLLIVLDYAQLEIRVMCLLCKDGTMTKVLIDEQGDIHQMTADEFNVSRDPEAKQLNFLLLYGGQEYMLSEQLTFSGVPTSVAEAKVYRQRHAEVYPRVSEYRQELLDHHKQHNHVVLFLGRRRHLPEINWDDKYSVHKAETTLSNNTVQGTGQDFLKAAIVRSDTQCINPDQTVLDRMTLPRAHRLYLRDKVAKLEQHRRLLRLGDVRWRLQVHDENIYSVRPEAAEECLGILADIMSWRHYLPSPIGYSVPLVAEGGVGFSWKAAKSKDRHLFHVKAGYTEWQHYA